MNPILTAEGKELSEMICKQINDSILLLALGNQTVTDWEELKFVRGRLYAYSQVLKMLGRSFTLVVKQEEVK